MKPLSVSSTSHFYAARRGMFDRHPPLAQDTTLRGCVAQLHSKADLDLNEVFIEAHIDGWRLPLPIPLEIYMDMRESGEVLQAVEVVPEHWHFPAPYMYFAIDLRQGVMVESRTLNGLVEELHRGGFHLVSSQDMRLGARFAREDSEVDDIVGVPLDLICVCYFSPDDWIEPDEENELEEFGVPRSYLPPMAELEKSTSLPPHYLFASIDLKERRLRRLTSD